MLLPFCRNFLQGFLDCSSSKTAEESLRERHRMRRTMVKGGQQKSYFKTVFTQQALLVYHRFTEEQPVVQLAQIRICHCVALTATKSGIFIFQM